MSTATPTIIRWKTRGGTGPFGRRHAWEEGEKRTVCGTLIPARVEEQGLTIGGQIECQECIRGRQFED